MRAFKLLVAALLALAVAALSVWPKIASQQSGNAIPTMEVVYYDSRDNSVVKLDKKQLDAWNIQRVEYVTDMRIADEPLVGINVYILPKNLFSEILAKRNL